MAHIQASGYYYIAYSAEVCGFSLGSQELGYFIQTNQVLLWGYVSFVFKCGVVLLL